MKNRLYFIAVLACIFIYCMVFASCGNPLNSGTYTVKYVITGPQATADSISYRNETGNFDSITNVPIPWEKTLTIQGRHSAVGFIVTIYFSSGSTYTAKIFINGKEKYSSSSSSGQFSVTGMTE